MSGVSRYIIKISEQAILLWAIGERKGLRQQAFPAQGKVAAALRLTDESSGCE